MRTTIASLLSRYEAGERFTVITAYDAPSARIVDRAGIPVILVGDSVGMVVDGHESTLPVTVDEMIHHTRAVARGTTDALIVTDLPFGSYAVVEDALRTVARVMAEGGAHSVKLEGGHEIAPTVRRIVDMGAPVVGHLGYTPQSVHSIGTRVQGRGAGPAERLVRDALALQDAGAWAIVLELVPAELATAITERLHIPTIGIGAGAGTSAQVQVWHDVLGFDDAFLPRHATRFMDFAGSATAALSTYAAAVGDGTFPAAEQSSSMDAEDLARALDAIS